MSQPRIKIALIVEGDGEMSAVPKLVSRWLKEQGIHNVDPLEPAICSHSSDRIKRAKDTERVIRLHPARPQLGIGIEYFVQQAMLRKPQAILVIVDADSKEKGNKSEPGRIDCPKYLGRDLLARAMAVCPHIPVGVVLANKEYESWFLYILPELQVAGIISSNAKLPSYKKDDEIPRGSKEKLETLIGRSYKETVDQARFTQFLPLTGSLADQMKSRSRSYLHLLTTLERLVSEARN